MSKHRQNISAKKPWFQRYRGWLIAFFAPFVIIGSYTVFERYDIAQDDIQRTRSMMGETTHQPGDDIEALQIALLFTAINGTVSGGIGVISYACFLGCQRLLRKGSNQSS